MFSYKLLSLAIGLMVFNQSIKLAYATLALGACGTSTNAFCGVTNANQNTYCLNDNDNKIYEVRSTGCLTSPLSLTSGSYHIFKQKSTETDGDAVTFTREVDADDTVNHVVYKAKANNEVEQVNTSVRNIFDSEKKILLECGADGTCNSKTDKGYYFAENRNKIVYCDDTDCVEEGKVGIYIISAKIYSCTGTSSITCVDKTTTGTCSVTGDIGKFFKDQSASPNEYKFCRDASYTKDLFLKVSDYTGYRKLDKAVAKIAFNIDDDILMKVEEDKYAVKIDANAGYYVDVDNAGKLYYCSANGISKCSIVDALAGYYLLGGSDASPDSYIQCTGSACTEVEFGTYDTCGNDDDLEPCRSTIDPNDVCRSGAVEGEVCYHANLGKLYESGKASCYEVLDKNESRLFYFNAKHKRVLPESPLTLNPIIYDCNISTCDGTPPTVGNKCKVNTNDVTYCSYNNQIYKTDESDCGLADPQLEKFCVKNNNELPRCEEDAGAKPCFTGAVEDSFCLSGKALLKTTSTGCEAFAYTAKTYYFDKQFKMIQKVDSNSNIYAIYNSAAGSSDIAKVAGKSTGELVRTPTSVEMCLADKKSISLTQSEQIYYNIDPANTDFSGIDVGSISNYESFIIKTTGKSIVKVANILSTEIDKYAALPTCYDSDGDDNVDEGVCKDSENGNPEVNYCIFGDNNNIYKKGEGSCAILTSTTANSVGITMFKGTGATVDATTTVGEAEYAYRCLYDDNNSEDCFIVKGYVVSSSSVIGCSGYANDKCVVTAITNCASTADGKIGKEGGKNCVCVGGKALFNVPSFATDKPTYIAYKSTVRNDIYEVEKNVFTLIEVGPNYAMKIKDYPTASGTFYFINRANPEIQGNSNSIPLIQCSFASNEVTGCVSAGNAAGTSSGSPVKYYVDGTDPKKVIRCTWTDKCESVLAVTDNLAEGKNVYYINGDDDKKVIKCTGGSNGSCTKENTSNGHYFIDNDDSKSVIYCNGSHCKSEKYVGAVANPVAREGELYIQCKGSSACTYVPEAEVKDSSVLKIASNAFNSNADGAFDEISQEGYEILSSDDASKVLGLSGSGLLVYVTASSVKKVNILPGYYPRVNVETGLANAVIYCSGNTISTCNKVSNIDPGYYLVPDENDSVIECDDKCAVISELDDECDANGGNIIDGYKLCISEDEDKAIPIFTNKEIYATLVANSAFPGAYASPMIVEISPKRKINKFKLKINARDTLETCDGEGTTPTASQVCKNVNGDSRPYCIMDSSNLLFEPGTDSCNKVQDKQGSTKYYYFDEGYNMVSNYKASPSTVKFVYKCEFTADAEHPNADTDVSSCTQITDYRLIKNTQTAVYCNKFEDENCVVHDLNTCSGTELGKLGRNGVVCFGSRSVELPTGNGNKIIAFVPTDFNKYYGTYELTFLKLEADGVAVAANNEIVAGYYLNESATSLKDALVYCSDTGSENCELVDGTNGYYVSSWGNGYVISCSSTGCSRVGLEYSTCGYNNILPECTRSGVQTDNVCSGTGVEGDNDTYCFGSDNKIYKNIVTGEGKSCSLIEFTGEETSVSFGSDHKRENAVGMIYYTCSVSGTEVSDCSLERKPLPECDSPIDANAECFNNAAAGSVCITSSGALYTTDEEGKCGVFKGTANSVLYFNENYEKIDFESPDNIVYTYKCTSTGAGGGLTNCVQASQVPGGVIKTSNSVALCASKDDSEKVDIAGSKEYIEMKGAAAGFPSIESTDEIISVKVTGDKNVMQLRDKASLPTCSNAGSTTEECKVNGEEVGNCIKNNIIYETYSGECRKLEGHNRNSKEFSFYKKDFSKSDPDSEEVYYTYQCTLDNEKIANYCKFAQGIVVTDSKTVNCNGWKGDECTVAAKGPVINCSAGEGSIRSGAGSICFDSNNVDLPTDGYIYTAFTTAEINSIYGILKDEIVLLKLTKYSALVASYSDLGDEEKYLIDQTNKENAEGKTPLILCKAGECSSVESGTKDKIKDGEDNVKEEGISRTYYIDGAYPFGNQIITCTQAEIKEGQVTEGSCTSSSPGDVSYYVDSAIDGNIISCGEIKRPLGYGDFPVCSDVPSGVNECEVGSVEILNDGNYCVKDGLIYISHTEPSTASCSAVKTCQSITSPFGLYATGSSVDNEKLIVCDGEDGVKCHYTKNISSESDCVDTEDSTKPANEGVIYIDGSSAGFMQCHDGKGEALNRNMQGYMLLDVATASKFLQGVTEPLLIENNAATYMVASTIQDGYYYNIGFDMLTNSVIRCTETSGCEAIDMDDIYCKGDHTKLPICTNIESDKACREYDVSETNMEHCIYNGKIYKNVNEDEVKCREIQALDECESVEESAKCIANASANSLCLHEGNMYINLENGCKAVNTLDTCESILSNDKCASEAEDNDLCRFGNGVYKTSSNSCQKVTTLIDEVGRIPLYFDSTAALTTTATTLSVKSMYICNNKYGVLSSCEKAVQDIGGLIFTRSERVKVVHVCVNGSSDETKYSYEITRQNGYQTIDIGKSDIFPGKTNPGKTVIDFEKNKAILVHEQAPLVKRIKVQIFTLPTCGTYPTAPTGNYCGLSPSGNTYCIYNDNGSKKIYEAKTTSCSTSSLTSGSYNIFKQKGETGGDDVTFTREVGTTGKYVVYSAGAGSVVTQVDEASDVYIFENDNKILLKCATGGECTPINTDGYYFAENRNKIVHCDGTDCAEESKVGIYIISAKIYSCTGTSSITCVDKTATQCESSGDIGKFKLNTDEFQLCKETTPTWVTLLKTTAYTGYRKVEKADAKIAFNIDDDILMKVKENTYAVKIDANAGYYVDVDNAGKLYYCSANGISKCSIVDASAGYYLLGGSDASPDSYIQCTGSACTEVEFGTYDTCGNDDDLDPCRSTIDPNDVCRSGAVEGEVCYHDDTKKLYESGKASCYEVMDKNESRLFYFNAKHKRVLPESPLTLNPIIYDCDVSTLGTCDGNPPSSTTECKVSSEIVTFCKDSSNNIYKTENGKCVKRKIGELINCKKNNNELPICEEDAGAKPCFTGAVEDSFCLSGTDLLKTTSTGCEAFAYTAKTYYFDKQFKMIQKVDSNSNIYAIYKSAAGSSDIAKVDEKLAGELVRTPTSVEMCLDDKKSISLTQSEQIYYTIASAAGEFAGVTEASLNVKTTGKSIVKINTNESTLKSCKDAIAADDTNCQDNTSTDVDLCITSENVIYKQDTNCQILKGSTAKSTIINYFNAAYKTPSSTDGLEHRYAYRCKFNGGTDNKVATECIPVTGYSISNTNLVTCSGFKDDDCEVTALTSALNTCANTEDGKIGKDGSKKVVCVGGMSLMTLSSTVTESPSYVAYKSTTGNMIYGTQSGTYNLLEVGPNYAMKAKYINVNNAATTLYFINSANPYIMENLSSEPIIKCTVGTDGTVGPCNSENLSAGGTTEDNPVKYFIDGSSYPTIKSVIQCTFNDKCKLIDAVKSNSSERDHFYYIHGEDDGIIKCTGGATPTCVAIAYDHESADGYYIDGYDDKSIITCDSRCSSEKFVGVVANPAERTNEENIQCKGTSACNYKSVVTAEILTVDSAKIKSKANGSTFEAVTSANEGYEIISSDDANKLFGLSGSKLLVYVTETSVKKVNINTGYYPRVFMADGEHDVENAVIYCSGNTISTCSIVQTIDPGYYLIPDEYNLVIQCDDNCAVLDLSSATTCSDGGEIIKVDGVIKLCISNQANEAIPIFINKEKYVTLVADSSFPKASDSKAMIVEISPKGKINKFKLKLVTVEQPTCKNTTPGTPDTPCKNASGDNVDYCSLNSIIYIAGQSTCSPVEAKQGSTQYYYFDKDYNVVSKPKDSPSTVKFVYKCEFTADAEHPNADTDVSSCTQITDYRLIKNTQTAVYCNKFEDENCVVHDLNTCSGTELGKLGRNGVVCFGSRSVELPTGNGNKIIAFVPTDFNKYYGTYELTFLKLEADGVAVAANNEIVAGYYLNESATSLKDALVYCSDTGSENCELVDGTNGYYVSSWGNDYVISCSSTGCSRVALEYSTCGYNYILPECTRSGVQTDNVCSGTGVEGDNDTYCFGSDNKIYKNVVTGEGKSCSLIEFTGEETSVSFGSDHKRENAVGTIYYTCSVSGTEVSDCSLERKPLPECDSPIDANAECFNNAAAGSVCITSSGALYTTDEEGKCGVFKGTANTVLYFNESYEKVDFESPDSIFYTYKCTSTGTGGGLTNCVQASQVPGGVIKTSNSVAVCASKDDSEKVDIAGNKEYVEMKGVATGFPSVESTDEIISVKVTGNKNVMQLRDKASLPTCSNAGSTTEECKVNGEEVANCIKNNIIYKSESGSTCTKITGDTEDFKFYQKDYSSASNLVTDKVFYAYQCKYDSSGKASYCRFAQGIVVSGSYTVNCNGWKGDECAKIEITGGDTCSSSNGEGGIRDDSLSICFDSSSVDLPTDGYMYTAFTAAEINSIYGKLKDEIVLLKLTKDSALVASYSDLGDEEKYLIDQTNKENTDGKTPLILCKAGECSSVESGTKDKIKDGEDNVKEEGIARTYYIDGAYPFGNQIITCTQAEIKEGQVTEGSCTSSSPGDVSYYVDSAIDGNIISCGEIKRPLGYGDFPVCSDVPSGVNECEVGGVEIPNDGNYCVKDGLIYISHTAPSTASCSAVKTCISITSPFGLYATGSSVDNEKLIVCDGEDGIKCHYTKNVSSESDCVDAEDNTKPANEGVIYIDGSSAGFMQCHEGKGEVLNRNTQGYMLLDVATASKFLQGVTEPLLIENNAATYMVASTIQDGYYYNIGFDMLTNSVIRCTETSGCEAIDMDDVHCKGDHTKLPICTNIENDKACREYGELETNMEHCIYNGKIYKNVNEDEVKCREIQALDECESVEESAKCIANASANSLCLHEGNMYINLENGCKAVNTLDTCESILSNDKCASEAEDNDLCRFGNGVYKTSSNSCQMVTTLIDEVGRIPLYFDSTAALTTTATTLSVKSKYICNNKYGVLSSCEKATQDIGGLIFTRSERVKVVHVCVNGSSDETKYSYEITRQNGYQTIDIGKSDIFPGMTNPGKTVIDFEKNKALLVHEQETIPECDGITNGSGCKSNGVPVAQCIMNNVLYLSDGNTCTKQTGPSNSYDFTYFDPSSIIIDDVNVKPNKKVEFVYKCEYNSSGVAERCYMVRGYVVVNDYILNCNGWSSCSFTGINNLANSCQDTSEGEIMGNGHVICLDEYNVELPTYESTYIMFKTETTNAIYGQKENAVVVLSLTPDSATVVPNGKGITKGYHQNVKVVGELTDALIYCSEDGVLESCDVVSGLNGYYLNTDSDGSYYAVIKCEEGLGCRKQTVDKTSCNEAGALIKSGNKISICKTASNSGKIDLNPDVATLTYDYISPIDASFPGSIEENKAFVKVGTDGSVVLLDNGIYINEGIHGKIDKALYDCTTLNVTTICDPVDALYGYYRNAGTVGLDDAFISCSLNGCEVMSVDENAVCSVNSIGQLVGSIDAPTLCLDYDDEMDEEKKVVLESETDESYMVGYYSNNIFGLQEGSYAYVNVTQNYVKFRSPDYVKYVYTENSYKELSGKECQANTGLNPKTLNEFKFEDFGVYSLNCVDGEDEDNLCKKNNA